MTTYSVLVIGAGPAGLACGAELVRHGVDAAVYELGTRRPGTPVINGIGGAGLYSDGKFSFYPSATALWRLQPEDILEDSYRSTATLLEAFGLSPPGWDESAPARDSAPAGDGVALKSYPSEYLSVQGRQELVEAMSAGLTIRTGTTIENLHVLTDCVELTVTDDRGRRSTISAEHVVIATGRLWSSYAQALDVPTRFRRSEFGVRVQQPAHEFFLRDSQSLDPKWIYRSDDPKREYRTFCCCRNGEVLAIESPIGPVLSGSSDCASSEFSNVGFMVRYLKPIDGLEFATNESSFSHRLQDLRARPESLGEAYPLGVVEHVLEGLGLLEEYFESDLSSAQILGPCVEGIGNYPDVDDETLELRHSSRVHVAGDATGLFRGIVAALISGHFVARRIADRVLAQAVHSGS